mmetsp:Transcript_13555/g.45929  ORF Transcript_13555/g.45929 Transcript_13555/m.45929 type:complete len:135 (-) Transcript_13555:204-608(-)|eukprot:CAMPEP_0206001472 /NCGR_PEP_ID=MMETSP1464-20131121/2135_1 /ASSEMBLY_ACC=CAM_ASM_001124 /TAXON_ID=119497 /ORGANISM="Exanthemachrysis gayraliae, Strain RCC1523" /LENGTH=134 /DNA_ID=CAMNT_0053374787 /DNA_START=20 /DNA_END=424 /DNA_ORIENTATION=-
MLRILGRADGAMNMAIGAGIVLYGLPMFAPRMCAHAMRGGDAVTADLATADAHMRGKGILIAMAGFMHMAAPNPAAQRLAALTMAFGDVCVIIEGLWAQRHGSKAFGPSTYAFCVAECALLIAVARACAQRPFI